MLKRFDSVVMPVRFAREATAAWKAVRLERERQRAFHALLRDREERVNAYFASNAARKLQIGAGTNPLRGWLNTDLEPGSENVIFLDALETFPFPDRAFDYVFSEHMIEHIPYKGGLSMLREACRVMKPGGRIRIATPDVSRITGLLSDRKSDAQREYIRWSSSESIGLYASEPTMLQQRRAEWAIDPAHIRRCFPDVTADTACFIVNNFFRSYGHQFLFDERTLAAAMKDAGFVQIERAEAGRSKDANLNGVDSHATVIGDGNNAYETLVLEAVRP